MIKERSLIGLAVIAVLAACGGGGGTTTVPGTQQLPAGYAATQFTITVPTGSGPANSARRSPKYVAPGTQSITLTLLQNNNVAVTSAPQGPFNLAAGQPGCVTVNEGVTCTFSVSAPIGDDVFLANTFSQLNGVSPLGSGAVALSVVQNRTNTASLTLTGPIASVVLVSNNAANSDTLWNGNGYGAPVTYAQYVNYFSNLVSSARRAQSISYFGSAPFTAPLTSERMYVIASDATGAQILNPTTYNQPVTLTLNYIDTGFGATANLLLSNTPPSAFGSVSSTSAEGGTVTVYSPADQITISLVLSVFSPIIPDIYVPNSYVAINFATVTASLASPMPSFSPVPYYITAENEPLSNPSPSPYPSPTATANITVIGE